MVRRAATRAWETCVIPSKWWQFQHGVGVKQACQLRGSQADTAPARIWLREGPQTRLKTRSRTKAPSGLHWTEGQCKARRLRESLLRCGWLGPIGWTDARNQTLRIT